MAIFDWVPSFLNWVQDKLTTSDDERVANACKTIDKHVFNNKDLQQWLKESGWSACGGSGAQAMRRAATRDAGIYDCIESFYQSKDKPERMLARFTEHGLNNGSSTKSYVINLGKDSIGRSKSNHQAVMVVDESAEPPMVTLAFRGMNPAKDFWSPVRGIWDALCGKKAAGCQRQADLFWDGAKDDITRIVNEVAARHPGSAPQIVVAGHSYGSDAAARMIPKLADAFPQWRDRLELVGYGGTKSFTKEERAEIMAILGNDAKRARHYMAKNDWVQNLGFGVVVGEQRRIPLNSGHVGYEQSSDVAAMMEAVKERIARDPKQAEAEARRLVEEFKRDPKSLLTQLAEYTNSTTGSEAPGRPIASLSRA